MQKVFCISEKCLLIISDHVTLRRSAANLTECLQASENKLSSVSEE